MNGRQGRAVAAMLAALVSLLVAAMLTTGCDGAGGEPPAGAPAAAGPLLPDEGTAGWETDTTTDRQWLLDPCAWGGYPSDSQRAGFRTVDRTEGRTLDARQVGVYPTPDAASKVMADFRRALADCRNSLRWHGGWSRWTSEDVPELGDDALLTAGLFGSPGYRSTGERIAVTRVGSSVFLAYAGGTRYLSAVLDGDAQRMRSVAQQFVESL